MTDVEHLIAQAVTIMRRHGVARVVLFGSQADGRATKTSDIDLAFWPGPDFDVRDYFDVLDELDELETLRGWDLVDMSTVQSNSTIAQEVATHGIELFPKASTAA